MNGVLGDFLVLVTPDGSAPRLQHMDHALQWPPSPAADAVRMHAPRPGVRVWTRGATRLAAGAEGAGALGLALRPAGGGARTAGAAAAGEVLQRWLGEGSFEPERLDGRFGYVLWPADPQAAVLACTDAFRTCPIYHATTPGGLVLASDLRLILRSGLVRPRVSTAAIYQYLNFSYVPAPLSAVEDVAKLEAGTLLSARGANLELRRYWDARYPEDLRAPEAERVRQLREAIVGTVESYRCADSAGWGTFLSGGTDSSSISGILARAHDAPVHSFSIGFAEQGYDELPYARIAAKAFGLQSHELRVGESDAVGALLRLLQAYDEPFGNSSSIPTLFCAELAASSGVELMIAGDGGDEIFGGNERYRKDRIFSAYHRAPAPLRLLGSALAAGAGGLRNRTANRVRNFVERASLPNPDRFYNDDAFASKYFAELLTPRMRAAVGADDALDVLRRIYRQCDAPSEIHRLMYLDLRMTIAENDLVKVTRAAKLAGVNTLFPYLDRRLLDFTGRLPGSDMVRGLHKRHLFKLATHDILPEEIRTKKKQGFGLPTSVWLRRGGPYAELVLDTVLSARALERGHFEPAFIRELVDRHRKGLWDHAADLHVLAMLELWQQAHVDAPTQVAEGAPQVTTQHGA
jgi:asparagine synthase (glutamine-hydrolysing)